VAYLVHTHYYNDLRLQYADCEGTAVYLQSGFQNIRDICLAQVHVTKHPIKESHVSYYTSHY